MSSMLKRLFPELDIRTQITIAIIALLATAMLMYLSILGLAGVIGGYLGTFLLNLFGMTAFLFPLGFIALAVKLMRIQEFYEHAKDDEEYVSTLNSRTLTGLTFLLFSIGGLLNLFMGIDTINDIQRGGGIVGYFFYPFVLSGFGVIAGCLLLLFMGLFGFFLISHLTFLQFGKKIRKVIFDPGHLLENIPDVFQILTGKSSPKVALIKPKNEDSIADVEDNRAQELHDDLSIKAKKIKRESTKPRFTASKADGDDMELSETSADYEWQLPPYSILKTTSGPTDPGNIKQNKEKIQETLAHFGITVEMKDVVTGPTVTQYTLKPANGVKLSAIDNLQRDLALALASRSIRIESPIAGKSLVGIEIPNKSKSTVRLKGLIETQSFVNFKDALPIAIGKDVSGKNLLYSLSKMPHLLVAGATGSGKSVWINGLLLSLLFRYSPEELQMILVDMKRVELKPYQGVPHLLSKVITDSEKAINALKWTLVEMERRYKLLEENGKRNIADYNALAAKSKDLDGMAYLVFIIDELGDLMLVAKSEVEPMIVRLTQMSRAVGIHLVLGTQRPDTGVVTGLIKANIPSRIAFTVASGVDSRVILDATGAEKLLGQGDGLMITPSFMHPVRFQGAFVEELEVKRCVQFLKRQMNDLDISSNLNTDVVEPPKQAVIVPGMSGNKFAGDNDIDPVYMEAKEVVMQYQRASTSFIQQMLGIGYPKAAKIINWLEAEGIVGPQNGSKPRDVYVQHESEEEA